MKNKSRTKNDFQLKAGTGLTGDAVFLAALSGLLIFLSFPKYGFGFIASDSSPSSRFLLSGRPRLLPGDCFWVLSPE